MTPGNRFSFFFFGPQRVLREAWKSILMPIGLVLFQIEDLPLGIVPLPLGIVPLYGESQLHEEAKNSL